MRKELKILLTTALILGISPSIANAFTNPLQKYNLYEDTRKEGAERNGVMSEYYYNIPKDNKNTNNSSTYNPASYSVPSTANIQTKSVPTAKAPTYNISDGAEPTSNGQRRNDYLRESSRRTFGNTTPGWLEGPTFYADPNFESIKEKYKASNFAGCMQEAEAYVRLHPNDTLGYYYLAMSYAKTGDKENAILAYEKVISLHDNPMIVKYATNGRNCVMNPSSETCYPNVNEPEYLYPYANGINNADLTPVDPNTLINRNLTNLQEKLSPDQVVQEGANTVKDAANSVIQRYPFAKQDDSLDAFIKAPYGSGLSPELEIQYKQTKLKELQQNINNSEDTPEAQQKNIKNIKDIDKKKPR